MRIIVGLLCLLLTVSFSFGNPILTANPMESLVDYYVLSINGNEVSIDTEFNMTFLYDLRDLPDGKHTLEIICGNYDLGEGPGVKFFLEKKTTKQWIFYTITKDPTQTINDPDYDGRFDKPTKVKIENNEDNQPSLEKSSGGGSGCSG
jgi:hypothetical protein